MKVKTVELIGAALDWAVAKCEGYFDDTPHYTGSAISGAHFLSMWKADGHGVHWTHSSTKWSEGGPIIERENITIIRANSLYVDGKNVPNWFAETDKWVGHSISTGYEGEYFDPCFMVDESGGYYGTTPLIAAMRSYVASKLGDEVEIPDELCLKK